MNFHDKVVHEQLVEAALQIVLSTGTIDKLTSSGLIEKLKNLNYDTERVNDFSVRAWAEYLFSKRRLRDKIFGLTLFSDPAWDILLQVLMSDLDGKPLTVSNAAVVADTPMTTGLRWLNRLEGCGLIRRISDFQDQRVIWIRLTPNGLNLMIDQYSNELDMLVERLPKNIGNQDKNLDHDNSAKS